MPLVWTGGKFWRPPFMNRLDGGSATKIPPNSHQSACQQANERWESLNLKTRSCNYFGFKDKTWARGRWTPTLDRFHGSPVMDQVHGYFLNIFIERFGPSPWTPFFKYCEINKNRNNTKIGSDETLSTANSKVITDGGITRSSTRTCFIRTKQARV